MLSINAAWVPGLQRRQQISHICTVSLRPCEGCRWWRRCYNRWREYYSSRPTVRSADPRSLSKEKPNTIVPLSLWKLLWRKVAFYSSDCHSESCADPDCLSLWVCVTSNMLGPGQKTYCSVAKKFTVNWMLSAHCWRTLCDPWSHPLLLRKIDLADIL